MLFTPTPLPPKDDPDRPLYLAVRSTRLLGGASVVCGVVIVLAFGYFNSYTLYRHVFLAGGLAVWVAPGAVLATCSFYIARRRKAAAAVAIVTAFFQGVCAALLFYASVTLEPVSPVPVVLSLLWVAAIVQLIQHLWRSLRAIRADAEYRRGFDVEARVWAEPVDESEGFAGNPGA